MSRGSTTRSSIGLIVAVLALFVCAPGAARTSGVRVKRWLDLPQLVGASPLIFTAEVVRTDHVVWSRRAYGRQIRFVRTARLLVKIDAVLRGDATLAGQRAWLIKRIASQPGRWVIVPRAYRGGISPALLSKGQRLIAFASAPPAARAATDKAPPFIELFAAEQAQVIDRVRGAIVVQDALAANASAIRRCAHERGASGQLVLDWVVGPSGRLESAKRVSSSISAETEACLMKLLRRWTFARPVGGKLHVRHGLTLDPTAARNAAPSPKPASLPELR